MHTRKTTVQTKKLNYDDNFYSLSVVGKPDETYMFMKMKVPHLRTNTLPHTYKILKKDLPRVLKTYCGNIRDLPFCEEVKDTELGHLFEHILLSYLCLHRKETDCNCRFSGLTEWNWIEEERGTFHITITATSKDWDILPECIDKTIALVNKIIYAEQKATVRADVK